jgi:putative FmdB family regulatory protein
MPTYEYSCENCGERLEKFQSIKAKPVRKCPECGKLALKRLIGSGAGIIFKGSGFYQTDYRSESYKSAAKNEKSTPAPAKTDTKTETKKEKPKPTAK